MLYYVKQIDSRVASRNCTFANNTATLSGGAVFAEVRANNSLNATVMRDNIILGAEY